MKNHLKLLLLSTIFVFNISCKTDENSIDQPSSKIESISSSSKIYNKIGNPYENVGQLHNAFIDHYYNNHAPDDLNVTIDLATSFYNEQYNLVLPDDVTNDQIAETVTYSMDHSITENIQALQNEGAISDLSFDYLTRLANYFENPIEDEGMDGFISKIESLEQELLSANLNASDMQLLLSTISVAKYSSHYWKEVYGLSNNTAGKDGPSPAMKAKIAIHVAGVDTNAHIKAAVIFLPGAGIYAAIASAREQSRIDKLWGK